MLLCSSPQNVLPTSRGQTSTSTAASMPLATDMTVVRAEQQIPASIVRYPILLREPAIVQYGPGWSWWPSFQSQTRRPFVSTQTVVIA